MKLKHIKIHNFRGIIDASIEFQPYTLLVGANNAGKSTVIDCIRAFYGKDNFKFDDKRDFPFIETDDKESWAELTFHLNDHEYSSLAEEYQVTENILRVKKYFKTEKKLHDGKKAAGVILGYISDDEYANKHFYGAQNVQEGKFGRLIYIPAISKVDEHTKLSGPSALRDLITNILSNVLEDSKEYESFAEHLHAFSDEVREMENRDKMSLNKFQNELNQLLELWETKFNFAFKTPSVPEIIKTIIDFDILDDNVKNSHDIDSHGSGFQRYFIYSLIRLSVNYTPKKIATNKKEFSPSFYLILFEEPEAFLHPPQQDELSRDLIKLTKNEDWQIICSTHSANFVSKNTDHLSAITRLHRKNGIMRLFQINDKIWKDIVIANHEINNLIGSDLEDKKSEMEVIKYFLWLNPYRSGMFFAQNVLLVEGPSEVVLINKLVDDNQLALPKGTFVMDCLGKYNIHRFMNLLSHFGIDHAVIYDDDDNKGSNEELNKLIIDSNNLDYTKSIQPISNDIESFLGVPRLSKRQNYKKPQHLFFFYSTGQISEEKLDDFCSLVEGCFPND